MYTIDSYWDNHYVSFYSFLSQFSLIEILSIFFEFIFTVRPLTVDILDTPSQLVAERRYEIKCESNGSRPNAIITWYKGKRQLRRTRVCVFKFAICWFYIEYTFLLDEQCIFIKKINFPKKILINMITLRLLFYLRLDEINWAELSFFSRIVHTNYFSTYEKKIWDTKI